MPRRQLAEARVSGGPGEPLTKLQRRADLGLGLGERPARLLDLKLGLGLAFLKFRGPLVVARADRLDGSNGELLADFCAEPTIAARFAGRRLRFHDLRHTCAAWLIAAGAHPLQIKLRLGHKEIRTTMDHASEPAQPVALREADG